jgi:hypothetical protein
VKTGPDLLLVLQICAVKAVMNVLQAEIARLQELIAVKEAQLAVKDELLASRVEESKLLRRELQLRAAPSYASSPEYADVGAKRQRVLVNNSSKDSSSSQSNSSSLRVGPECLDDRDELLDEVFSFVGAGDHLYAAGVSRRWRGRYLQHCAQTKTPAHDSKCVTRYCSATMSESRLQHAKANGLRVADIDMTQPRHAGLICYRSKAAKGKKSKSSSKKAPTAAVVADDSEEEAVSSKQSKGKKSKRSSAAEDAADAGESPVPTATKGSVITVLRLHGVPWDNVICRKAAYFRRLRLLQWLHNNGCQWSEVNVLTNASRGGSVPWSERVAAKLLNAAASCDELAAAQWLRAACGAQPASFASKFADQSDGKCGQCWSVSTMQWALACGSGWRDWKCDDYTDDKYTGLFNKQQAAKVLSWAHANGCPCTCEPQQQQEQQLNEGQ